MVIISTRCIRGHTQCVPPDTLALVVVVELARVFERVEVDSLRRAENIDSVQVVLHLLLLESELASDALVTHSSDEVCENRNECHHDGDDEAHKELCLNNGHCVWELMQRISAALISMKGAMPTPTRGRRSVHKHTRMAMPKGMSIAGIVKSFISTGLKRW